MNERQTGSMGDELTNAALTALISVFALGLVLAPVVNPLLP